MKQLFRFFKPSKNQPLLNLVIIGLCTVLFLVNLIFKIFSFVFPSFNAIAVALFLLIPFVLVVNGFFFRRWWLKLINFWIFLLPSLLSLWIFNNATIIFLLIGIYQPEQEIKFKYYNIVVYKSPVWLDTDAQRGFILKQEKIIFPGIKLAKPIYENKNRYLDRIENYQIIGRDKVILDFVYYDVGKKRKRKESKEFQVKDFIYF
ncbi:hypothetical protein OGM63_15235 [Plectonema radiosum NIES-515]|uniref:Uncharacterized protein n=1 Tax=Plectonema radiosum NIES-515 TaxID=2986073 RepID=A0ABT3B1W2_9CYAN|nr:hypothetical protein [Plectonema radiosum]MCV3214854.1 hypothetical protein [Plectonema radiosum NIES-515]